MPTPRLAPRPHPSRVDKWIEQMRLMSTSTTTTKTTTTATATATMTTKTRKKTMWIPKNPLTFQSASVLTSPINVAVACSPPKPRMHHLPATFGKPEACHRATHLHHLFLECAIESFFWLVVLLTQLVQGVPFKVSCAPICKTSPLYLSAVLLHFLSKHPLLLHF